MTTGLSDNRFNELFALIGDPVVEIELVDRIPVVRAVNPAFEEVFGYARDEILGQSLNEFIVPDDRAGEADQFDRRTVSGKQNTGLVTRETADGQREFFYRGVPYERDGARYGFAIYTDVTDQRRYERHFQVINRLLRHDLRNNLQLVIGTADRIVNRTPNPEVSDLAEAIIEQAELMVTVGNQTRIIEEVLLDENDFVPVDVASVCQSVAADMDAVHPTASIAVETPDHLRVDGIRWLPDAVEALVENAAVHGGDDPTVRVSAERRDDGVVVAVADDGPGIPQELRAPVFEDHTITQLQHNRGIGLWLVRWVVEACDGHIAYAERDDWTVVEMWLQPTEETDEPSAVPEG